MIIPGGEVGKPDFFADVHQHGPNPDVHVAEVQGQDLLRIAHRLLDSQSKVIGLGRGVRVEGPIGGFCQVPEHFVELPDDLERREHGLRCSWVGFPADALEKVLGDVLSGSEAVEDGAASEASRAEAVVDRAGEVGGQVLAGSSCWFIDGEVRAAGKAQGGAAESEAVTAIGTQ
ncbi:hypothetical protein [Arthrobacter sp. NPDC092385]|uniref:hypothetical protein n=1 Tax=Arthrobacter sp. NPDC092385 TaxID=3363943 RepID=UPI003800CAC2